MTDGGSSIPAVQALLRVLAADGTSRSSATAFGEGAAAMAETARWVVTVELDPERAAAARERLAGLANVELLEGDCYEALRGRGPFGLVFADGGRPLAGRRSSRSSRRAAAREGRPDAGPAGRRRPVREFLLRDPRLAAVEILTTPATAAIVAVRV